MYLELWTSDCWSDTDSATHSFVKISGIFQPRDELYLHVCIYHAVIIAKHLFFLFYMHLYSCTANCWPVGLFTAHRANFKQAGGPGMTVFQFQEPGMISRV